MSQQYGLGRGLASLIPPKKKIEDKENASHFQDTASPAEFRNATEIRSPSAVSVPIFPSTPVKGGNNGVMEIPVEKIFPNPHQPRFHFDKIKLEELAESIKEHGILQPLIVSSNGERYEIIAGERRF